MSVLRAHNGKLSPVLLPGLSVMALATATLMQGLVLDAPVAAEPGPPAETITCLAFAPDGTLVSGGENGTIILWDVAAKREKAVLSEDGDGVNSLALSADGLTLAVGHRSGHLVLWDLPSRQMVASVEHAEPVTAVAVSPGGVTVVSGDAKGRVRHWSRTLGKPVAEFTKHDGPVTALA